MDKLAFWASMLGRAGAAAAPAVRNTVGNLAGSVARGVVGMGAKAGATGTMKAVNGLTQAATIAAPIAGTAFAMNRGAAGAGKTVQAAYAAGAERAAKFAGLNLAALAPHADHLTELAGLGVLAGAPLYRMAAPEQFQQKHPHVGEALDLAGLGILAVPALRGLAAHKPAGIPT